MKTIYKYPVHFHGYFDLQLPKGAKILYLGVQFEAPYIWVIVDSEASTEIRYFHMMITGIEFRKGDGDLKYIGSYQICKPDVEFVGHLFEITNQIRKI